MKKIITTLSQGAVKSLAALIRKKISIYSTDFGSSSERIDVFDGRAWISIFGFMNDDEEPDQENEDGHTFAIAKKKESDNPGRLLIDAKIVESISTITMENNTSKRGLDVIARIPSFLSLLTKRNSYSSYSMMPVVSSMSTIPRRSFPGRLTRKTSSWKRWPTILRFPALQKSFKTKNQIRFLSKMF
jgi:hypothetical protein